MIQTALFRSGRTKHEEIASNCAEALEFSALSLHLLQAALLYTNTRMAQTMLSDPVWAARIATENYRGLSPLIYSHINPYGRFEVDLEKRIDFDTPITA